MKTQAYFKHCNPIDIPSKDVRESAQEQGWNYGEWSIW